MYRQFSNAKMYRQLVLWCYFSYFSYIYATIFAHLLGWGKNANLSSVLYSQSRLSMSSHSVCESRIYFHCGMRNQWFSLVHFRFLRIKKGLSRLTLIQLFLLLQLGHRNDMLICIYTSNRKKKEKKRNLLMSGLTSFQSPLFPHLTVI